MRILIIGGPKTGKTTLATELGERHKIVPRSTDELVGKLDWSAASAEVARWFEAAGDWIIEGVAIPRALRKWLAAHPVGQPADKIVFMSQTLQPLTPGQEAMGKGLMTVWTEILPELQARKVLIVSGFSERAQPSQQPAHRTAKMPVTAPAYDGPTNFRVS